MVKNHVFGAGAMVVAIGCLFAAIIYAQVHFNFNSTAEMMETYAIPGFYRDIYIYSISITGVSAVGFLILFIAWILGIIGLKQIVVVIVSALGLIFGLAAGIMCGLYGGKFSAFGTNSYLSSTVNNSDIQKYVKESIQDWYEYAYTTRCKDVEADLTDILPWSQIKFGEEATGNFQYSHFFQAQQGENVQKVLHFQYDEDTQKVTALCGSQTVVIATLNYNYSKEYSYKIKNYWPLDKVDETQFYSVGTKKSSWSLVTKKNNWLVRPGASIPLVTIVSGKYDNKTVYSVTSFPVMYNKVSKELEELDPLLRIAGNAKADKALGMYTPQYLGKLLDKKFSVASENYFRCSKEPANVGEASGVLNDVCALPMTTNPETQDHSIEPLNGYFYFSKSMPLKKVYLSILQAPGTGVNPPLREKGVKMDQHEKIFNWNSLNYAQIGYSICGIIAGGVVLLIVGIILVFMDNGDDTNGQYRKA